MRRLSDLIFPQSRSSPAVRYSIAAAACFAAFFLRLAVDPVLQDHSPFVFFSLAVAASGIRGGFGPGILATFISALLAVYFFPPQGASFAVDPGYRSTAVFQLLVFLLVGFVLSWLSGSLLDLQWKAMRFARQRSEILESITDGFAALDTGHRFVYLNSTAARLIGCTESYIIGKNVWEVIPDWKNSPVETGCLEVSARRIPVRFEYLLPSSGRWLEFHLNALENGSLSIYFSDITARKETEHRLRETLAERDTALQNVRLLSGLLPICASCKKIRDSEGGWQQLEQYISTHSQAEFSHGLCPECVPRYLDDFAEARTRET